MRAGGLGCYFQRLQVNDTAAAYMNEAAVGKAIAKCCVPREDMTQIAKLDIGHSEIVNHGDAGFVKLLHSKKIHD